LLAVRQPNRACFSIGRQTSNLAQRFRGVQEIALAGAVRASQERQLL
jgi:hypothetical protein